MMYAKILHCGVADFTNASEEFDMVAGEKLNFFYDHERKPFLKVINKGSAEHIPLYGDVFVMSESGKTISQFAVPTRFL